jgi:hypothetical protein
MARWSVPLDNRIRTIKEFRNLITRSHLPNEIRGRDRWPDGLPHSEGEVIAARRTGRRPRSIPASGNAVSVRAER